MPAVRTARMAMLRSYTGDGNDLTLTVVELIGSPRRAGGETRACEPPRFANAELAHVPA